MFGKFFNKDNSLQEILLQAIDAVVTIDKNNLITFYNPAAEKLWGYTQEEVLGKNVKMLVPVEFRPNHDNFVNANRETGQNKIVGTSRDVEVQRKDGTRIWGSLSLSRFEVDGDIQYTAFLRDISAAKNQQEMINQTLTQALDAVVTIDENNIVTFYNPSAERLWGYSPEEVLGQNVKMLVPMAIQSRHDSFVNNNRTSGVDKIVGTSREVQFSTKSGEERWAALSLSKVDLGDRIVYTAFLKDVTDTVIQRERIRLLSLVADETDNSVIITGPDKLIEYVNPGFTKLSGYTLEESVGRKPGDLLQGEGTDAETVARVSANLSARQPFYEEILNYAKDGTPYWISLAINPVFDEQGELKNFVSIQANVTQTKLFSLEFDYKLQAIGRVSVAADYNLEGRLIDANQLCFDTFGCSGLEALKQSSFATLNGDVLSDCLSGNSVSSEFSFTGNNGEEIWLAGAYSPIFDSLGKVIKVALFAQVATERKQVIDRVSSVLSGLSQGDLSLRVDGEFGNEFNALRDNLNESMVKLGHTISAVGKSSAQISTNSKEISHGNIELSSRTESQASSLEETASSMEEMIVTVKQTSDNASQANQLADEAKQKAEKGGEVVRGAMKAMAEILDSSNKISDIIGVIDEIAFQTNLLALNAAVEAARAGEQGRGFAVVAGEVRTLSQRSAAAAKEIKDLIRDSVGKVEVGSTLVNQSGATLTDIEGAVDKVAAMIHEVSNAAKEQTNGIGQINQAIAQMDEMTQRNAALVEETAAASQAMTEESTSLNRQVGFFRLS